MQSIQAARPARALSVRTAQTLRGTPARAHRTPAPIPTAEEPRAGRHVRAWRLRSTPAPPSSPELLALPPRRPRLAASADLHQEARHLFQCQRLTPFNLAHDPIIRA